jgi:hypothetical protein
MLNAQINAGVGDNLHTIQLPPGFGDCLILELTIFCTNEATAGVFADAGIHCHLSDAGNNVVEAIGVGHVKKVGGTAHAAQVTPDSLVVWKQDETVRFLSQALDTNAAPTAIWFVRIRVRRVRDVRQDTPGIAQIPTL